MPKYKIVDGHKKIDGKMHGPGDIVECTEETAAQLRLEPVYEESNEQRAMSNEKDNFRDELATEVTEDTEKKENDVADKSDTDKTESKKRKKK